VANGGLAVAANHHGVFEVRRMRKSDIALGMVVRFRPPAGLQPLLADASRHLLSGCIGSIVSGPNGVIWCFPEDDVLDLVWVRFDDDIRPIRQVTAAWLEEV
jgi:hypothetical protein